MGSLSKKERAGIVLMMAAMVFFTVFIWWGTTSYPSEFAVGIIILAGGIFLSGIVTFNQGNVPESSNPGSQLQNTVNEPKTS
jgi:hypothetical protein